MGGNKWGPSFWRTHWSLLAYRLWYFLHRDIGKRLEVRKSVTACLGEPNHITRLEHAQARLTLSYNRRGDLAIHLVSPMGTRSTLLAARCSPCCLLTLVSYFSLHLSPRHLQPSSHIGRDSCVLWDYLITGILP